jgi:hypothetical protein
MSAADKFVNFQGGLQSPPSNSFVITPSDTTELPFVTRSVYVGAAGDITLRLAGDTGSEIIKAVAVGTTLPIRARQIYATGTTAALPLVGIYQSHSR